MMFCTPDPEGHRDWDLHPPMVFSSNNDDIRNVHSKWVPLGPWWFFWGRTNQKYPQYCWEFHDQLWEALSGTTSEKRSAPSRTGGEIILEMLWKPQMPWIIRFGASQPYSWREFQETLWERFRGLSGVFPEFLPESASRTGGMAQPSRTMSKFSL